MKPLLKNKSLKKKLLLKNKSLKKNLALQCKKSHKHHLKKKNQSQLN
jgi:hypothetical protein